MYTYLFFYRVFRRFLEIQDISNKNDEMTYEELKTIVASYLDLCKCPELKVHFLVKPFLKHICYAQVMLSIVGTYYFFLGKSISQTDLQGFL